MCAFRPLEILLKKGAGTLMNVEQHTAHLSFLRFRRTAVTRLGQRDAKFLRDRPHRLGESDVLDLLHEAENVSRQPASEAVIELPRSMHGKRWRLLAMKGTQPRIILRPSLLQLDVIAHNADDVRLLLNRVREIAGVGHGWRVVRRNCESESREKEYIKAEGLRKNCGYRGIGVAAFGKG